MSTMSSEEQESFEGLPEVKYALKTSVDVERSFSMYKNMLTNNRHAFKFDNIKKWLILQSKINYK